MITDEELTQRALNLLMLFPERARLAKVLKVSWNRRMRSAAGRAFWPDARIELNPLLNQISEEEVERTLRHELAHILVYARYGPRRQPHGAEWQLFCTQLGIPGESATHRLTLPSRKMKRVYRYTCPSCGKGFDRVKQLKKRSACYECCKTYNRGTFSPRYVLEESRLIDES